MPENIKDSGDADEWLKTELEKFCLNYSDIKCIDAVTVRNTRFRFPEANQAAPSFCTQHSRNGKYEQPYCDSVEITQKLRRRGVEMSDEEYAVASLGKIGYYRLKGYGLSLRVEGEDRFLTENYRAGTQFEDLIELYEFDRQLRIRILDAIERIEVAFRARLNDTMASRHGSHWFMQETLFSDKRNKKSGKLVFDHQVFIEKAYGEARRNKESLPIRHYYQKYGDPILPPCWMLSEVLSMGTWSKAYGMLANRADQKAVADHFCTSPPELASWIHALTNLRNTCAHHNRLWDRRFVTCPSKKKNLRGIVDKNDRLFAQIAALLYCLLTVDPESKWLLRLNELIAQSPHVELSKMGFPDDWLVRLGGVSDLIRRGERNGCSEELQGMDSDSQVS